MSILPQQNWLLKTTSHHTTKAHLTQTPARVRCATTAPPKPKPKPKPGPPSHLLIEPTPLTTTNGPRPNDPDLKSTWTHRVWVASGCTSVLISLAKSISYSAGSHVWAGPVLAGLAGYILADLGSGVYHWGIDNYGDNTTPIFGPQIEAFQGHHKWPWTITKRQFANNLHSLARAITFTVLPIDLTVNDPALMAFVGSFSGFIMFSQQFHAWAHSTKSKLPKLVVALQEMGVLVSRSQHGAHHRPPYNSNYCIVSGIWNEFLDQNKVFEVLEMVLYFQLGARPRSWNEPSLEWAEESSTSPSSLEATN